MHNHQNNSDGEPSDQSQLPETATLSVDAPPARSVSEDGRIGHNQCGGMDSFVDVQPSSARTTEGTMLTNRVPSNDNSKQFNPLRFGIDSLYLSYVGRLAEDWDKKLEELKEKAQSDNPAQQAFAQVTIGSHVFEVRDKGVPRFPYVLVDNCFWNHIGDCCRKSVCDVP